MYGRANFAFALPFAMRIRKRANSHSELSFRVNFAFTLIHSEFALSEFALPRCRAKSEFAISLQFARANFAMRIQSECEFTISLWIRRANFAMRIQSELAKKRIRIADPSAERIHSARISLCEWQSESEFAMPFAERKANFA